MAETITPTPLRVRRSATKPILNTLVSLSSRLKPRPLERLVRTISPSRTSILPCLWRSSLSTISAMVVLPAPERPVNHSVNPRPHLLSFSITILLVCFPLLLLEPAGLLDDPLFVPHTLDEDLDDLRTAELGRRVLAPREHLPHLRPREKHVRVLAVRAGVGRRHPLAVKAEKGVLEEQGDYAQLVLRELREYVVGHISARITSRLC